MDRDARSRATNHVNGVTVRNSTQQSMGPAEMAQNHKERALENAALARENAKLRVKQDAEREREHGGNAGRDAWDEGGHGQGARGGGELSNTASSTRWGDQQFQ